MTDEAGCPEVGGGMTVSVRIDTGRKRERSGQMREVVGERDVRELIRNVGQKARVWRNRDGSS